VLPTGHVALDTTDDQLEQKYPRSGATVDGRLVRTDVPNLSSIGASFSNYEQLPGLREVPMHYFPEASEKIKPGEPRIDRLADQMRASGQISPLIVAVDNEGPYILEGAHRFDALRLLKAKSFPASVVLDLDMLPDTLPKTKDDMAKILGARLDARQQKK